MDKNKAGLMLKGGIEKICRSERFKKMIIIIGFTGIGLIFISTLVNHKSPQSPSTAVTSEMQDCADEYRQQLEQSLADIISKVDGAGKTQVFLTMESSAEVVYAADEKQSNEHKSDNGTSENETVTETNYITIKLSDGTQQAVKLKELEPQVRGVIVVCEGGNDSIVQENIMRAVKTVFNISSTKVCILKSSD